MFRFSCFALFAAALLAQDPADLFHKPSPDVDQALRARVNEFFEYHVKGEYRRAEALVAEDTKDFFYDRNKPNYLSFEIKSIKYNEDFTKAVAMVQCEQIVPFPEFQGKPVKVLTPSNWKLEDGKWFWYVDMEQLHNTPFGRMWNNTPTPAAGGPAAARPVPPMPTIQQFYSMFSVDKDSVTLSPGGTDQIVISNTSPGVMTVHLVGSLPGVETKLGETQVKAGEKTVLTFHAGQGAKAGNLQLRFDPVGKVTPITVSLK